MNREAISRQLRAIQNQINANLHAIEREAVNENMWWTYHQFVSVREHLEAIRRLVEEDSQEAEEDHAG